MPRDRSTLALILTLGLALRLLYFFQPFADAHGWRQVDTAAIARNFHEGTLNPFSPRVDWGGAAGFVESEFPLVPFLTAVLYRLIGYHELIGRVIAIALSLALVVAAHRLALALEASRAHALAAAALVAVAPSAVFFGRTVLPDTPMLLFATLALAGFVEYSRHGSGRWLAVGSACFGLACLVKIPALVVAAPIATALMLGRGRAVLADRRVWMALVAPLAVTAAWYWHAANLFEETGLTFGILIHPAKTYPPWISPGPWPSVFSKWSTPELLASFDFYERMFARLYHFHLMPVGLILAVLGALMWRGWGRAVAFAWLLALVAFVLVVGEGHRAHDYYQLPFVVVGAVLFGAAAAPAFEHLRSPARPAERAGWFAVLTSLAIVSFYYSGVTQTHFRSNGLDTRVLEAGASVDAATDDNALAIVVDDYGVTSPLLLYFAHLEGWSFDVGDLTPELVDRLRRLGARYFVTTQWERVQRERPEAAAFLARYPLVDLPTTVRGFRMFSLR